MAPDVSYRGPQRRERPTGAEVIVRFFAAYPGDWRIRITHLVADGRAAASKVDFDGDTAWTSAPVRTIA